VSRARRRDRRVYLRSHPVLFTVLAATCRRPVRRVGHTLLVNGPEAFHEALTRVALDRAAPRSTGGTARQATGGGLLFDQEGEAHRRARRALADSLSAAQVDRWRPVWSAVLADRLAPLAEGREVDLVPVAAEVAGRTAAALLGMRADPSVLAAAAAEVAALAVREEMAGRARGSVRAAADRLRSMLTGTAVEPSLASMLTVAAVNTTISALPRAAAWCADARLWAYAEDVATLPTLAAELLRVLAPSPILPRVAAEPGSVGGCPVRAGDRMILVARHAAAGHRVDPDPVAPMPAHVAQMVFGVGAHACPGAALARAQLQDLLAALAVHRPVVVAARAARRPALPGWASLRVRGTVR
jgi:cytochrome P450